MPPVAEQSSSSRPHIMNEGSPWSGQRMKSVLHQASETESCNYIVINFGFRV